MDRVGLLAGQELFNGLSEREISDLANVSHVKKLLRGETLCRKGDDGSQIYVVASGHLKAVTTSSDGADVVFSIMGPGELCGELALLSGGKRTATMEAHDAVELVVIERRDFLPFLRRNPDACIHMMETLARMVLRLSETLEDTQFRNLPSRLAKRLLQLADQYGRSTDEGVRIDLRLSQSDLGTLVATTRESINKQIRVWSDSGLVTMSQGTVTVRDSDALKRVVEEDGGL